jgi:hypothetical protein
MGFMLLCVVIVNRPVFVWCPICMSSTPNCVLIVQLIPTFCLRVVGFACICPKENKALMLIFPLFQLIQTVRYRSLLFFFFLNPLLFASCSNTFSECYEITTTRGMKRSAQ